jgi:hypothetical protein
MPKHTPGPWSLNGSDIEGDDGMTVVTITEHRKLTPRQAANARLIAAAPQMLRALQRLTHPAADDDDLDYALDVIRAATGADQ